MPEVRSTFRLDVGDPIPEFRLPDAWGEWQESTRLRGPKGMLVVFACNHCPYVVHVATALGVMAREILGDGVTTVAVNPNDLAAYPQDGPEPMKEFARAHGWEFPYLLDPSQETAVAFGAACTPDFFLCDGSGCLVYAGQFDESRPKTGQPATGSDLRGAVRRMLAGEPPAERSVPASGCSIKWKPGNTPVWWNAG